MGKELLTMKTKFTMPDGEIIEKEMPLFKTQYNHDRDFESERTAFFDDEPSLTKQEFKEETDINVILDRFMKTGQPPPITLPEHFGDLTTRLTYFDAATAMAEANALFYMLPAAKRAEHLNDPNRWADAIMVALEKGDRETLTANGIQMPPEKPQGANLGDPPSGGSPAPKPAQTPPEGPKTGATPVNPQSDTQK